MIYEGIEQVQKIQLEMLDELDRICKVIDVKYFIIGGTALGAVRHAGFIPWDDDIDVGMIRDDYEKFLSRAPTEIKESYFLQEPGSDPCTYFIYAKLRKNSTTFAQFHEQMSQMHKGIYIDIFPFDNIPDNDLSRVTQYIMVKLFNRIHFLRQCPVPPKRISSFTNVIRYILWVNCHQLLQIIPKSLIIKILANKMTEFNKVSTGAVACLLFPKYLTEYMDRKTLFPLSSIEFCGKHCPCPNNIDRYLVTHYGNYMKLPPVNERINHKPYTLDTGLE